MKNDNVHMQALHRKLDAVLVQILRYNCSETDYSFCKDLPASRTPPCIRMRVSPSDPFSPPPLFFFTPPPCGQIPIIVCIGVLSSHSGFYERVLVHFHFPAEKSRLDETVSIISTRQSDRQEIGGMAFPVPPLIRDGEGVLPAFPVNLNSVIVPSSYSRWRRCSGFEASNAIYTCMIRASVQ